MTIYSGANRITNSGCKIDLGNFSRIHTGARVTLRGGRRGFTKLSLRRTVSGARGSSVEGIDIKSHAGMVVRKFATSSAHAGGE